MSHYSTHPFPNSRSSHFESSTPETMNHRGRNGEKLDCIAFRTLLYCYVPATPSQERPIGRWLGEEGVGVGAVRDHSPVVTRRGGLTLPSWTTIADTPEAAMRSIRRSASSYWSLGKSRATWTRSSPISSVRCEIGKAHV